MRRNKRRSVKYDYTLSSSLSTSSSPETEDILYGMLKNKGDMIINVQSAHYSDAIEKATKAAKEDILNDEYKQKIIKDLNIDIRNTLENIEKLVEHNDEYNNEGNLIDKFTTHLEFLQNMLKNMQELEATTEEEMKKRKKDSLDILTTSMDEILTKFDQTADIKPTDSKNTRTNAFIHFTMLLELYNEGKTAKIDDDNIPVELKNALIKFDKLYGNGVFADIGAKNYDKVGTSIKEAINSIKISKK